MVLIKPHEDFGENVELHTHSNYEDLMTFIEKNHINKVIAEEYNESIGAIMENKSRLFTAVLYGDDVSAEDPYILHFINFASTLKSTVPDSVRESLTTIKGNEDLFDRHIAIVSFKQLEALLNYLVNVVEANDLTPKNAVKKFNEPNPITILVCEGIELARHSKDYTQILFSSIFGGSAEELNKLIAIADIINNEKQKRNITSSTIVLGKPN
jgi:hypothetical protein